MSAKGYLTAEEVGHLARLNNNHIGLSERKTKVWQSISHKFLLGLTMVLVLFTGRRRLTVRLISVATVSFSVVIPGILLASELEAFFYIVLTVIGALLAMKFNKQ
jgi:hypothetical protein